MTQLVQIKSNGNINILFNEDGPSLNFEVSNPLVPSDIADSLNEVITSMLSSNAKLIHMEQDEYRIFTHTIRNGLVEHQDAIDIPVFMDIMNAQNNLIALLGPQP